MKCYIMRGIPGSGKDYWIYKNLSALNSFVCSSDSFFVGSDGIYRFDRNRLPETHNRCLLAFMKAISDTRPMCQAPLVLVNITNIRVYEIAPYYRLAEALGYEVEIVYLLASPEVCKQRNTHNVPPDEIDRLFRSIEPIPSFWKQRVVLNDSVGLEVKRVSCPS
jgi:predicted kinase